MRNAIPIGSQTQCAQQLTCLTKKWLRYAPLASILLDHLPTTWTPQQHSPALTAFSFMHLVHYSTCATNADVA
jgi:hypothetical protein